MIYSGDGDTCLESQYVLVIEYTSLTTQTWELGGWVEVGYSQKWGDTHPTGMLCC